MELWRSCRVLPALGRRADGLEPPLPLPTMPRGPLEELIFHDNAGNEWMISVAACEPPCGKYLCKRGSVAACNRAFAAVQNKILLLLLLLHVVPVLIL